MEVSPQPANEKLTVKLDSDIDLNSATATLFDLDGNLILVQSVDNQNFELLIPGTLSNGIYFLQLQTKTGISTCKVLVQH